MSGGDITDRDAAQPEWLAITDGRVPSRAMAKRHDGERFAGGPDMAAPPSAHMMGVTVRDGRSFPRDGRIDLCTGRAHIDAGWPRFDPVGHEPRRWGMAHRFHRGFTEPQSPRHFADMPLS